MTLTFSENFRLGIDRVAFARKVGIEPDAKQIELLHASGRTLVCCTRQWGKSTTAAILAAHEAIYHPGSTIILASPSQPQSTEIFRRVHGFWRLIPNAPISEQETLTRMSLENGSRIISLPGSEKTTRGYSGVGLVILDEASRVDDSLIAAIRPMQATIAEPRFICLSTPAGRRGWFFETWTNGGDSWNRIMVKAEECPRISATFLAEQREELGETKYQQEFECAFIDSGSSAFNSALIEAAFTTEFDLFFPRGF